VIHGSSGSASGAAATRVTPPGACWRGATPRGSTAGPGETQAAAEPACRTGAAECAENQKDRPTGDQHARGTRGEDGARRRVRVTQSWMGGARETETRPAYGARRAEGGQPGAGAAGPRWDHHPRAGGTGGGGSDQDAWATQRQQGAASGGSGRRGPTSTNSRSLPTEPERGHPRAQGKQDQGCAEPAEAGGEGNAAGGPKRARKGAQSGNRGQPCELAEREDRGRAQASLRARAGPQGARGGERQRRAGRWVRESHRVSGGQRGGGHGRAGGPGEGVGGRGQPGRPERMPPRPCAAGKDPKREQPGRAAVPAGVEGGCTTEDPRAQRLATERPAPAQKPPATQFWAGKEAAGGAGAGWPADHPRCTLRLSARGASSTGPGAAVRAGASGRDQAASQQRACGGRVNARSCCCGAHGRFGRGMRVQAYGG